MTYLHLDFETFSELPLDKVGAHRYVRHPSTEVLLHCWAVDDGPVQVAEGLALPEALEALLTDPDVTVVAFNAEFERLVLAHVLGREIPPERFLCTMARAWSQSFVGGLDDVCREMGLPGDKVKLARGKRVMQKFSKPRRPSKHDSRTRWTPEMDPEGWAELREYGAQDVVASREVLTRCARYPWHPAERSTWNLDQRINDTGWPLDRELVLNANRLRVQAEDRLRQALKRLTGLDNPNSVAQLRPWLEARACTLENLQKGTVEDALSRPELLPEAREALSLRLQLARATPKKWDALERAMMPGNVNGWVVRGTLRFGAAQRTQRWGGRLFQPQNLYAARGWDATQVETLADILTHADLGTLEALYDEPLPALARGIRSAVSAHPGRSLVVCDLASIESRILGWLSGCERINSLFASGRDTYRDLAARLFNIDYDQVTKEQRTFAKPPDLGCGYLLGGPGLVAYAAGMGVEMDLDFAKYAVQVWRASNPEVTAMWSWLQESALAVTTGALPQAAGYGVRIRRDDQFLFIDLPSGRSIHYYRPEVQQGEYRPSLTYMGRYQEEGGGWSRVWTHPGKLTENIVQAVARDVLRDALLDVDINFPRSWLVGHVHDEIVMHVPEDHAQDVLAQLETLMSRTPDWAPGLRLGADGFICNRYMKG